MIQCIVGLKGAGKTKQLISLVNNAVEVESGSVICIERDDKLKFDINHHCRLIETRFFEISGFDAFFGFICGLYAQNYDITSIFIDSLYKIVGSEDPAEAQEFMEKLARFSDYAGIKFVITISADPDSLPPAVAKYVA